MRRLPLSRLLLAAALALVLSMPAPLASAAPVETPVLTHLADWLTSLFRLGPESPARHADSQGGLPTVDPDGLSEAPSPTLTISQTEDGEGETIPTVDPDG